MSTAEYESEESSGAVRLPDAVNTRTRYELKGEIARGGMGAILRVFDKNLRRHLAMKVVLSGDSEPSSTQASEVDPRLLARFLEEAQVTGQLDHPGVVPVHELGIDSDGRVYFTMRLVEGRELTKIIDEVHAGSEEWPLSRAAGVLLQVCETMAFAHDKGVIHRDLKPANVMVGRFGEVYVMDWGLARVSGTSDAHDLQPQESIETGRKDARESDVSSPLATLAGTVIGTPHYMPPEQAVGRLDAVTERSDVYAIGAMAYHLLAGRPPYETGETGETDDAAGHKLAPSVVLQRLLKEAPEPLPAGTTELERRLREVCTKAMAREPEDRYPSTEELAQGLRSALFKSSYRPARAVMSVLALIRYGITFVRGLTFIVLLLFVAFLFFGSSLTVSVPVDFVVDALEQEAVGSRGLRGSLGTRATGTMNIEGAWTKPLLFSWLLVGFLFVYALGQLGGFVRSLSRNQPFDPANSTRLRRLGFVVFVVGIQLYASQYLVGTALAASELEGVQIARPTLLSLGTWMGPAIVFMITGLILAVAEAFRLGASLQDQEAR